jgi:secernin
MFPQSCDTMVALGEATAHGQTIFAKNSDRPGKECQPLELHGREIHAVGAQTQCQFVTLPEVEVTYRHVGSRPIWCWGYEHGFNEHQVVIGNEAVHSHLPVSTTPKLIGMEILRLGLERGKTAVEAVDVMTSLVSQYGQGKFENDAGVRTYDNSYIVADPHEAYVIETAGHDWVVKKVEGALGISNVYSVETDWVKASSEGSGDGRLNFADAFTKDSRTEGSGAIRRARSCAVLSHLAGQIDVQTMMHLLSDHGSDKADVNVFQTDLKQGGICVHCNEDGTGGNTAASLVADLCADRSRLPVYWCGFYSPCLALFLPTFIEGQLPSVLGVGSETHDDKSPWWLFHKLSRVVREKPEERIALVRNKWCEIQGELFKTAYAMAEEGRHLMDGGSEDKASKLLTDYMNQNTRGMLDVVGALLDGFEKE